MPTEGYKMYFLLNRKKSVFAFLAIILFGLVGCYYEDMYYENADTDYEVIKNHNLYGDFPLQNRILSGKISISEYYFKAKNVYVTELDSSLNEGTKIEGDIEGDKFFFPKRSYKSPYVKISVDGIWTSVGKLETSFSFETLTDISNVDSVFVRLVNHLEVLRVKNLVKEGFPFAAAKSIASNEIQKELSLLESGSFVNIPLEKIQNKNDDIMVPVIFMEGDSLQLQDKWISSFRKDFADGSWDDAETKVAIADNLLDNWLGFYKKFLWDRKWGDPNSTMMAWQIYSGLIDYLYGLEKCDPNWSAYAILNEKSVFFGDSVICDNNLWPFKRLLTEREKKLGSCSYSGAEAYIYEDVDSVHYTCDHRIMLKSKNIGYEEYYKSLEQYEDHWSVSSEQVVLNHYLGKCCSGCGHTKGVFRGTVYQCDAYRSTWNVFNQDTLSYYLNVCSVGELWTIDTLHGKEYVCTTKSWQPINDEYKFLASEKSCDRESDRYRVVKTDSSYYICDSVELRRGVWAYTFKETDSTRAQEYEFWGKQEPCKDNDELRFVSYKNNLYRCQKKGDSYSFVKTDKKTAINAFRKAYMAKQGPCEFPRDRFRNDGFNAFDVSYFYICDFDADSNYVVREVSRESMLIHIIEETKKLYRCTDSVLASRPSPVEIVDGSITDPRDGQKYKVVTIGNQVWMAENLNYSDSLSTLNLAGNSWCYDNEAESCTKYGRLYSWSAALNLDSSYNDKNAYLDICLPVQGICPDGWHIPTMNELEILMEFDDANNGDLAKGVGLKSVDFWEDGVNEDLYGFNALPAGYWSAGRNCEFRDLNKQIILTTVDQIVPNRGSSNECYKAVIGENYYSFKMNKRAGASLRCVKDL